MARPVNDDCRPPDCLGQSWPERRDSSKPPRSRKPGAVVVKSSASALRFPDSDRTRSLTRAFTFHDSRKTVMAYLVPSEFVTKMVDAGESKILMSTRDTVIRAYM